MWTYIKFQIVIGVWTSSVAGNLSYWEEPSISCSRNISHQFTSLVNDMARIGQWDKVIYITDFDNLQSLLCPSVHLPCDVDHIIFDEMLKTFASGSLAIIMHCSNIAKSIKSVISEPKLRWFGVTMVIFDMSPFVEQSTALNDGQLLKGRHHVFLVTNVIDQDRRVGIEDCKGSLKYSMLSTTQFLNDTTKWKNINKTSLLRLQREISRPGRVLPADLHLNLVGSEYKPFFNVREDGSYDGLDFLVIKTLSEALGFSYNISLQEDESWGGPQPDGSWNGMIGAVYNGNKDVALSGIYISSLRREGVDFTRQLTQDPASLMLDLRTARSLFFIGTFDITTWMLVTAMPIVAIILYFAAELIGRKSTNKKEFQTSSSIIMDIIGILFAQGSIPPMRTKAQALLIGSYMLTVVGILAVYSGNLTASLASNRRTWPFKTLRDFAESDFKLYVNRGSHITQVLRDSHQPIQQKLWSKVMKYSSTHLVSVYTPEAVEQLDLTKALLSSDQLYLKELARSNCDYVLLPENLFGAVGMGLVVAKDSPLKAAFDPIILHLAEMGLIEYWYREKQPRSTCAKENTAGQSAVTLTDITFILKAVLGGGLGLATLVFTCELFAHLICTRYNIKT